MYGKYGTYASSVVPQVSRLATLPAAGSACVCVYLFLYYLCVLFKNLRRRRRSLVNECMCAHVFLCSVCVCVCVSL